MTSDMTGKGERGKEPSGNSFERTSRALDFGDVRNILASMCKTGEGKELSAFLEPVSGKKSANGLLDKTGEMITLIEEDQNLFPSSVDDPGPVLKKISRGILPEPDDIQSVLSFTRQLERLREFHDENIPGSDGIRRIVEKIEPLDEIAVFLNATFGGDGKVKPDATAHLIEIGGRIASLQKQIKGKAESMLHEKGVAEALQESYITIRNDRIVLPIKAEYKNKFPGIIHGISASDKTAFMEPQELVRENNDLQEAISEREVEIYRLLRRAAELLKENRETIIGNYRVMGELDLISAKAEFSQKIKGTRPRFSQNGEVSIIGLKHPLMILQGENPRPNSIELGEDEKTLVISGPNAGGKTVLLKASGLMVVFSLCGIFVPAREGTSFPFASKLFAIIGDEQSVAEGESTFSAQLKGIKEALTASNKWDWILIDEILSGTDPRQAGALALTVMESLNQKGCTTFVSTHIPEIKIAAQESGGMVNGAMGFGENGKPTYKLEKGHPGVSYPLAVAESIGLPAEIIEKAKERLTSSHDLYQSALMDLQKKADRMDKTIDEYETKEAAIENMEKELAQSLDEARIKAEAFEKEKRRLMKEEIRKKKTELSAILLEIGKSKKSEKEEAARKAAVTLKEMENKAVRESRQPDSIPIDQVPEGGMVWIVPLDRVAKLLKKKPGGKLELLSGGVRMTLAASDVIGIKEGEPKKVGIKTATRHESHDIEMPEEEILLLGLTMEESIAVLEPFLDRHMLAGSEEVVVIHGRGPLKNKIEEFLRNSAYAKSFRTASPARGGDGATIVTLE